MTASYNEEIGTAEERTQKVSGYPPFEKSLAPAMRASVAGNDARTRPPNKQFHRLSSKDHPRIDSSLNFCQAVEGQAGRPALIKLLVCYDRKHGRPVIQAGREEKFYGRPGLWLQSYRDRGR